MSALDPLLSRVRRRISSIDLMKASPRQSPSAPVAAIKPPSNPVVASFTRMGISLAAEGGNLEQRWNQAVSELERRVHPVGESGGTILTEGGIFRGSRVESAGSIATEVLDRFAPRAAERTQREYARYCRADGLMPYKLTGEGPGYAQIQMVTPQARSVWKHYRLTGASREYLHVMYEAMAGMDAWLAAHRDTRGTGAVEAFCTFDTGQDNSPRFWLTPERCFGGDAASYERGYPQLPYIAPDLTANVACQRKYLAKIAEELGKDPTDWLAKADATEDALWRQCYDERDECFYDRTADGSPVRLVSDVLLRVLACEIGDETQFTRALERYVMNTRHLLSPAGWTSLSMSDPRFDRDYTHNSWGGPVNFLSLLRVPAAFECHGHVAELALVERSILAAVLGNDRFPQSLDPWTGRPGFEDHYGPAILWLLDSVERATGVQPREDGCVWFNGLPPTRLPSRQAVDRVAYARTVDGVHYEMVADDLNIRVLAEGEEWLTFSTGWRVEARDGKVCSVTGLGSNTVSGTVKIGSESFSLDLPANHVIRFEDSQPGEHLTKSFIGPHWD